MNNQYFRVGDKVYCPRLTNKICTIKMSDDDSGDDTVCEQNSILAYMGNCLNFYFNDDMELWENTDVISPLIHATKENHKLLTALYPNTAFEPPPTSKNPKEIIKAMLDNGWAFVCYFERGIFSPIKVASRHYFDAYELKSIVPFDPKTGRIIVDYVDGQIVLESEND